MHAHALLTTETRRTATGSRTFLTDLRSHPPIVLRQTSTGRIPCADGTAEAVRVCIAAGAAGPLGGDHFRLDVRVGDGGSLLLTEVSSTMLLPGARGGQSRFDVRLTVGHGATLVWLARPLIAVRGCDHVQDVRVNLAADARLLVREQAVLGRHGEQPGRLRQRVRVRRDGRALYCQDLTLGGATAATPAVVGDHHTVGSLLLVDPGRADIPESVLLAGEGEAALLPVGDGVILVTALAADTVASRRQLDAGLTAVGHPWDMLAGTTD